MTKVNQNFLKLPGSYLFSEVARRISVYSAAHPEARSIKLSIGDVTRPLAPAVIEAMHQAVTEMGTFEGFHGYGPEQGYDFLREAMAQHDYAARGVDMKPEEIFVSDGAKSDCGNIGDIFGVDNVVAVCDPVYPVYVDTNAMAGRAGEYQAELGRWSKLVYMPCVEEMALPPSLPRRRWTSSNLCFPNNPTGAVATKEQLKVWVDYANENGGGHPVRLRLRGLHHRGQKSPTPSMRWRAPAPAPSSPVLLQDRRLHRQPLRLHRGAHGAGAGRRQAQRPVEPPPVHQVQRCALRGPAGRGRHLHPRGQGADPGVYRLLPEQRQGHPGRPHRRRSHLLRRCERPLHLAENAQRHGALLGVL